MVTAGDLEDFLQVQVILSASSEGYAASKNEPTDLVESFKALLKTRLRDCLRQDDRPKAITLLQRVRRELLKIQLPVRALLHEAACKEMMAFGQDWKLHVTRARFDRLAAHIDQLCADHDMSYATRQVKALFVELIEDPEGDSLLSAAGQRWGHLVSVSSCFSDSDPRCARSNWDRNYRHISKAEHQKARREEFES